MDVIRSLFGDRDRDMLKKKKRKNQKERRLPTRRDRFLYHSDSHEVKSVRREEGGGRKL